MIQRVTHVTVYVKNDDEALAFFTGKLGFKTKMLIFRDLYGNRYNLVQSRQG